MFPIEHLNLINEAKSQCRYLIVGVSSDDLVYTYKSKTTVIKECDRAKIVRNLKNVDKYVIVDTLGKAESWHTYKFDTMFVDDDWKDND